MQTLLRWGLYPGVLITTLLCAWWALQAGHAPGLILAATTASTLLLLALLEHLVPARPDWRATRQSITTDILHGAISNGLAIEVLKAAGLGWLLATLADLARSVQIWPDHWPLLLQVLLGMLLGELCFYTLHRAAHEIPWLWPWHAVHHSSSRLVVWSAPRSHPVNAALSFMVQTGPAIALGAGIEPLLLLGVFTGTNGNLQHCNVDHRTGALGYLLATARQHRWHHARDPADGNSNYGSNLMIWDLLLGTHRRGPEEGPPEVGLDGVTLEESYAAHLAAPFRWTRAVPTRSSPG